MRIADVADVADVVRIDAELPSGGVTIESKDVSSADVRRRSREASALEPWMGRLPPG